MAIYLVRIELRNSEDADYDGLHDKLSSNKFYNFHTFPDVLRLPGAEYIISSTENIKQIGYLAKSVAEQIKPNPRILVTEVKNLFQLGLDKC
ncbi:DUF2622 domain-containing protein [Salmonella enterica subsp. enterica]|uniref:hypothetical protein n=1 Tax=Salmonella enterica TaxID=28901 RepID=UPI0009EABBB0|nr:hypothetical protein [Salmonella enterica]EAA9298019.1 DUF2622 domain-containing protein [Salmonella enterica subsp. enterica serovar Enteritidis]EBQ5245628.1 DUF2622 domain-containing protein [Salmonella enterica subsp. salamae]EDW2054867.1 DUF2622 domain-containing protein [Salmonella enterica subsp. enterica]ECT1023175.1 DUF2622 domain-containing protein [Salmonella enterica]EHP1586500.1 DUF2622 domain-containing protein [Salmonella enterica]